MFFISGDVVSICVTLLAIQLTELSFIALSTNKSLYASKTPEYVADLDGILGGVLFGFENNIIRNLIDCFLHRWSLRQTDYWYCS